MAAARPPYIRAAAETWVRETRDTVEVPGLTRKSAELLSQIDTVAVTQCNRWIDCLRSTPDGKQALMRQTSSMLRCACGSGIPLRIICTSASSSAPRWQNPLDIMPSNDGVALTCRNSRRVSVSGRPGDFTPGDRVGSKLAVIGGGQMFAMKVEKICDLAVGSDETLALPGRLEAHHASFSSSKRKVRIFCAVVQALVRAMLDARHQFSFGGGVRAQPVSYHDARGNTLAFEQLTHQPKSRTLIPAAQ